MYEFILIVHVILAALLIGLVLLQQGKGGGMGTAFGGATDALLSTPAAGNILSRGTAIIATSFFVTSLSLGYLATQKSRAMHESMIPSALPIVDTTLMTVPTEAEKAAAASEAQQQQPQASENPVPKMPE
jgi:preprotein translocase subunit SecG